MFISRFANLEITTICDRQAEYGLPVIGKNKAAKKGLQHIFATISLTQVSLETSLHSDVEMVSWQLSSTVPLQASTT